MTKHHGPNHMTMHLDDEQLEQLLVEDRPTLSPRPSKPCRQEPPRAPRCRSQRLEPGELISCVAIDGTAVIIPTEGLLAALKERLLPMVEEELRAVVRDEFTRLIRTCKRQSILRRMLSKIP